MRSTPRRCLKPFGWWKSSQFKPDWIHPTQSIIPLQHLSPWNLLLCKTNHRHAMFFFRRQHSIPNSWIIDCHSKTRLKPCFWKQKSANRYFYSFNFFYFTESPIPKCISTAVVWAGAVALEALNSSQVLLLASQLLYIFFCQCTRIDPWEKTDRCYLKATQNDHSYSFFLIYFVILSRNLSEKNMKEYIFFAESQHNHVKNTESLVFIQKHASWLILAHPRS